MLLLGSYRLALASGHTRYTIMRLARAGLGHTVLASCLAVVVLILVLNRPEVAISTTRSTAAVFVLALLAASVSGLAHALQGFTDQRRQRWETYLQTLPGQRCPSGFTMIVAASVVALLAAAPVILVGFIGSSSLLTRAPLVLALVPLAALPAGLLGQVLSRVQSSGWRWAATLLAVLTLLLGVVAAGSPLLDLPPWLAATATLTPTFAAADGMVPFLTGEPAAVGAIAAWLAWCAGPPSALLIHDRLRRSPQ